VKEILDALALRFQAKQLANTITGGIYEGEVPERTPRPNAEIMPGSEQPGAGGVKRTNMHEYLTASFDVRVIAAATFEELSGTDVAAIDAAVRYAAMTIPAPFVFNNLMPGAIVYYWEDKFHKAIMNYSAWFQKPAAYNRQ
jgi:hypothetical protein